MRRTSVAAFIFAAVLLGGCATRAPLACPEPWTTTRTAKVFFATDRRPQTPGSSPDRFGKQQTDPPGLNMGWQEAVLGPTHRLGRLDQAVAITPANVQSDLPRGDRANALKRTDAEIAGFVNTTLRQTIRSSPAPRPGGRRPVLVFIHGFNTTFSEAIRKTAQLAGDLELVSCAGKARGVAIAYSWPAQGTLLSYLADEENIEWTQQRLVPFLRALATVCEQEHAELHLIAHSMGARGLIRSLAELASSANTRTFGRINQVVLLAPDISKELFEQYLERFIPLVAHVTIYVSSRDRALSFSRLLHGSHGRVGLLESTVLAALELAGLRREDHRQLGYLAEGIAGPKIDMVDVSSSFTGPFGHSYEDPQFIVDLRELIHRGTPAGRDGRSHLEPRETRPGFFFRGPAGKTLRYFRLRTTGGVHLLTNPIA